MIEKILNVKDTSITPTLYLRKLFADVIRDRYLYMLLIPFLAYYVIFSYRPMYSLQIAFKDYNLFKGIEGSPWIGFQNFVDYFSGPFFWRNLRNTLIINLYSLVFSFPMPIILALLFNEIHNKVFKKAIQTFTYMPHFISVVVIVGIVTNFLAPTNGLINLLIERFGGEKVYFLTKPEYFRSIYIIMNIWKETGFSSVIYIAAISGISDELYEAATIDGANRWKQTLHVTIPAILPTIMIMLIMRIGNILEVGYETIILLYNPATYETADVISTYVYRSGITEGKYHIATAVGLCNSVIGLFLVYFSNRLSRRLSETSLW